jgi:hypothetical protein
VHLGLFLAGLVDIAAISKHWLKLISNARGNKNEVESGELGELEVANSITDHPECRNR